MSTHIPTHNACFKLVSESYMTSYTKCVPISLEPVCINCALWKLAILRSLGCLPIHTIMTHQKVILQSGNLEGIAHPPSPFCYSLCARRRSYVSPRRRVTRSGYGALRTLSSPLVMQQFRLENGSEQLLGLIYQIFGTAQGGDRRQFGHHYQ